MREKARERCSEQVQDFTRCCKDSGILMVVKCRKENSALKDCLTAYYNDPAFYEECKMEYLKEREEFRKTGIPAKKRLQKLPTSMIFTETKPKGKQEWTAFRDKIITET
ncbi:COX assembly mitochondrial protein homolog isoform 3-T4 [Trichechus inunguis]